MKTVPISEDSGISNPMRNVHKNTFFDSSFGYNCIERWPSVGNVGRALDLGSLVNFDNIVVLLNSDNLGGLGGLVATSTIGPNYEDIFVHELGHGLGLLADGYDYSTPVEILGEKVHNDVKVQNACTNNNISQFLWTNHSFVNSTEYLIARNMAYTLEDAKKRFNNSESELTPYFPTSIRFINNPPPLANVTYELEYLDVPSSYKYMTVLGTLATNSALQVLSNFKINNIPAKASVSDVKLPLVNGTHNLRLIELDRKGKRGNIKLSFDLESKYVDYFSNFLSSNQTFQLLDRKPDPIKVQAVLRSKTDKKTTYRSSFYSKMSNSVDANIVFDPLEEQVLKERICWHIKNKPQLCEK